MGLFDKKFCDICGEKIGMLGNRKLEDGNMCKDCAKKLSPFCDDRRHSTLEQMKAHLQYREENKAVLRAFTPTLTLGEDKKIYIDQMKGSFVVSRYAPGKWDEENPDVMPIASITSCGLDIDEDRDEIYMKNGQGQNVSYNPPRYNYYYNFKLKFLVSNPYFDDFEVKLNNFRVEGMGSMEYNRYQKMAMDIMNALGVNGGVMGGAPMGGMPMGGAMPMNNMGGFAPQGNMYGQQMVVISRLPMASLRVWAISRIPTVSRCLSRVTVSPCRVTVSLRVICIISRTLTASRLLRIMLLLLRPLRQLGFVIAAATPTKVLSAQAAATGEAD